MTASRFNNRFLKFNRLNQSQQAKVDSWKREIMENIEEKMEKIQRKLSEINRINNLTAHVINVKISVDSSTSVYQGNLIESCEKCSAQKLKAFCNGVSSCCKIEIGNYGTLCDVISLSTVTRRISWESQSANRLENVFPYSAQLWAVKD